MAEARKAALRVNFDRKLKLEFHGVKVTSDVGLLAYRELDDVFGLSKGRYWKRVGASKPLLLSTFSQNCPDNENPCLLKMILA